MNNKGSLIKNLKVLSLIAGILIVVGIAGAWWLSDSVGGTITIEERVNIENIESVSIRTSVQSVRIHHAANSEARIISSGIPTNATLTAEVVNGVLTVETRWPRQFGINFGSFTERPTLDVYLPTTMYEQITIRTSTGRIEISDFTVNDLQIEATTGAVEVSDIIGDVNIRTSTGRITASGITGDDLYFRATTGNVELTDMRGDVNVQTSTGRITASGVTGDDFYFRVTTGNVELSHVTGHIDGQTSTGRITINNTTIAQNMNLQATTGNVAINLEREPENARFSLTTTTGRRSIFGQDNATEQFGDGRYEVTLRTSTGRITVE